jgi:hypothetical protein
MKGGLTPCHGYDQFQVEFMLTLCATCPHVAPCRQRAADSPFTMASEDPQVWGGLVLPRENHLLPRRELPTTATVAERRRSGPREWWEVSGVDPDSCTSGSHTAVKGTSF